MTAITHRQVSPSGNRDNDYFQAECSACNWTGAAYSNRTAEGRQLAERATAEHNRARHSEPVAEPVAEPVTEPARKGGRKSNKAKVLTLAAELGVEVEYGQMGAEGFEVALYGYGAHMAFDPMGEGHTAITNQAGTGARTESRIWGMALEDLREFVPCADDCHCRVDAPVAEPAAPAVESVVVTTRYYVITDDAGTVYTGAVIGNCEPAEAMRTMVGIVQNVSRETVTLATDGSGWVWEVVPVQRYGTARFLSTVVAPANPYK